MSQSVPIKRGRLRRATKKSARQKTTYVISSADSRDLCRLTVKSKNGEFVYLIPKAPLKV